MENTPGREKGFRQELEPIFEMLRDKEKSLSRSEWESLVNSTKDRIIDAPSQYLSGFFHPETQLKGIIDAIFKERLN